MELKDKGRLRNGVFRGGVALLIVAGLLAGCQTTDPATREKKTSQAATKGTQAAFGGAIACGLVSLMSGEHGKTAMTKAAACGMVAGVAGAAAGALEDERDRQLLAEFQRAGLKVDVREKNLVLVSARNIAFSENSAIPDSSSAGRLPSVARIINRFPQRAIEIVGHASNGEDPDIGFARARAIRNMLSANGVASGRISISGRGTGEPLVPDAAAASAYRNRRVEIFFVPVS